MKRYGYNKSTEFTAKQISVIYRLAKSGEIKLEKWVANEFYRLADYYGYDDNRAVEESETKILAILKAVFNGNIAEAQEKIDSYTEKTYNLMGRKYREAADRSLVQ